MVEREKNMHSKKLKGVYEEIIHEKTFIEISPRKIL